MRQASKGFRAAEEEVMTIFLIVSLLAAAACQDHTASSNECRQNGAVQIQDWCEPKTGGGSLNELTDKQSWNNTEWRVWFKVRGPDLDDVQLALYRLIDKALPAGQVLGEGGHVCGTRSVKHIRASLDDPARGGTGQMVAVPRQAASVQGWSSVTRQVASVQGQMVAAARQVASIQGFHYCFQDAKWKVMLTR